METFEIVAKKNKKRMIKRIILWSTAVVLALGGVAFGTSILLQKMASKNMQEVTNYYDTRQEIAYPNIYSSARHIQLTANFTYSYQAERMKDLDGVLIPYNEITASAGPNFVQIDHSGDMVNIHGRQDGKTMIAYSNGGNVKVPQFFNVKNKENDDWVAQPSQELPLVSEMKGQLVEVALTFDKAYSYEELQTMLPDNLKQNWYWLGTYSSYNVADMDMSNLFGFKVMKGDLQYSFDIFRSKLKEALTDKHGFISRETSTGESYNSKKELEYLDKTYKKAEDCKFSGVILTGKAENFAQLEGKEWIYASSIGASTPNQPYYKLDKE
ncbi:Uncharacterised protein [Streptococcus constellatus]|uniref:Sigma factor regulator C-terminal domain-containing protein n=1 Tax=Streptococcus constellatus TaxID=76860 RepID=A0A564SWB9_STRCV|nr:anti sigma factor C-terminal domain-containing protein [Streptococcus constellatus]VUW99435.1 Uncharacterised protein [Streptococcus constellatus]VUX07684.1 Uncharacterised protein [Streptococcus gordonii]